MLLTCGRERPFLVVKIHKCLVNKSCSQCSCEVGDVCLWWFLSPKSLASSLVPLLHLLELLQGPLALRLGSKSFIPSKPSAVGSLTCCLFPGVIT